MRVHIFRMIVGVVPTEFQVRDSNDTLTLLTSSSSPSSITPAAHVGTHGSYGYCASNGHKLHATTPSSAASSSSSSSSSTSSSSASSASALKSVEYGEKFGRNTVVGIELDLDAGTLSFWVDQVAQGVAFTGLRTTATLNNPNILPASVASGSSSSLSSSTSSSPSSSSTLNIPLPAGYHIAVSLSEPDAAIILLGEKTKPKAQKPKTHQLVQ